MKYEYAIFNTVIVLAIATSFFFFRKFMRLPSVRPTTYAVLISMTIFLIWDQIVTNSWWYFNQRYITGIYVGQVPLEEVIFFITVPLGCLTFWVNLKYRYGKTRSVSHASVYKIILLILLVGGVLIFWSYPYTRIVLMAFGAAYILDTWLRTNLTNSKLFVFFIFIVTNIFTFIFNLYLTARPIITYNPAMQIGFRVLTIPVEDFVFGMTLIGMNIILYEFFIRPRKSEAGISKP